MIFRQSRDFQKAFKRLKKKYKSLDTDLKLFEKILKTYPKGNSRHFYVLTQEASCYEMKARFFCRYLKGSSLRIVYVYDEANDEVEFTQLYFKGEQVNHF